MRRNNYLALCALLLSAGAASAIGAGCSGDNTPGTGGDAGPDGATGPDGASTPDSGKPDTSTPVDSGAPVDTGLPIDSGAPVDTGLPVDSGPPDGGQDSGHPDSGQDSGHPDAGQDSGQPDAGQDSGQPDAGQDSGQPDGGSDASDGSIVDGNILDGNILDGNILDTGTDAAPIGFNNPVQIDVSAVLNARTVVTTAPVTGSTIALTSMDNAGNNDDFPTTAEMVRLTDSGTAVGLPNNAFFPTTGSTIPDVQLAWNDSRNNVQESLVVAGNAAQAFSFNVPPGLYAQLQIFATGGNGGATLNVTLTYATGLPVTSPVSLPDWCVPGTLGSNAHKLISVQRIVNGNAIRDAQLCSIYALDTTPDPARILTKVTFTDVGTAGDYLVFYGATAW